jgi:hypothetical protein
LIWIVVATLLGLCAASLAQAASERRYVTTTIHGVLSSPKTGAPMAGATLQFTPVEENLPAVEATTNANGEFAAEGLGFGMYVVNIRTAEGEMIRGVNALPIHADKPIEIEFTLSERIVSETMVANQPQRFVAMVDVKPIASKRFWKEFLLYLAIAGGSAAAVF